MPLDVSNFIFLFWFFQCMCAARAGQSVLIQDPDVMLTKKAHYWSHCLSDMWITTYPAIHWIHISLPKHHGSNLDRLAVQSFLVLRDVATFPFSEHFLDIAFGRIVIYLSSLLLALGLFLLTILIERMSVGWLYRFGASFKLAIIELIQ